MEEKTDYILIHGGRIVDPGNDIDMIGDLIITRDIIAGIEKLGTIDIDSVGNEYRIIHAEGMVVCPGFVDLHCHLRQPGYEEKETIASGTLAAAAGGYTTVCCMPNTNPPLDSGEMIKQILNIASKEGHIKVLPIGCITEKRNGKAIANMSEMVEAGAVGFSDDGSPVSDDGIMEKALNNSICFGVPIIDHCEKVYPGQDWDMNSSTRAKLLGLRGMPENSEELMVERDITLNRNIGGHLHIAHVSTARSASLIRRAKESGIRITAEVTPHHLTLTEDIVVPDNTNTKVNPPLRTKEDIEILIEALNDNVIDIISTDHAPHSAREKLCSFEKAAFGISGLETALGSLMGLVHKGKISLKKLVSKLTCEPAAIIKNRDHVNGTLKRGCSADVTIFDPNREWIVRASNFISKGKNTPLDGKQLTGKVMATIWHGKLVFFSEEFISNKGNN